MRALAPLVGLLLLCAPAPLESGEVEETKAAPSTDTRLRSVEAALDRSADPCRDFYRFACGGWLASARLPEGERRWSRGFSTRRSAIRAALDDLLVDAARSDPSRDALARAVGDFHASCLDVERIEERGLSPLAPWLERIDEVDDLAAAFAVAAELGELGAAPFFALAAEPEPADARLEGARIVPGGLGLPTAELYLGEERATRRILSDYRRHVAELLTRTGLGRGEARRAAREVVALESDLARVEEREEGEAGLVPVPLSGATDLPWRAYFAAAGRPDLVAVARVDRSFAASLALRLAATPPATLRAYLRWHAAHAVAPLLTRSLVEEDFRFFGQELAGRSELPPRAERCRSLAARSLPAEVGALYVERSLSQSARRAAEATVAAVAEALAAHLPALPWLDPAAAETAAERIREADLRVGRSALDSSRAPLSFDRGRLFENVMTTRRLQRDERFGRVGRPFATAPPLVAPFDVDAYWDPLVPALEIPAGLLAPPFLDPGLPPALRFGALGALAGHELAHALDSFEALDVLAAGAAGRRREAQACLSSQVSALEVAPDARVDGDRVLAESVADALGLAAAHAAFRDTVAERPTREPPGPSLDDERLFFVAWAQTWCTLAPPEALALQVREDTHAPPSVRATAALLNSRDFRRAFRCEGGDPMAPLPLCALW
ncbi:MAG: M13 family metallopeptidase [Acidobacteria bacterium]|nr:M13 family metallopeptidase [Acidobacteriota bacterium]MCB9377201.1 M13 family metallopeptidase [Holophagales bacterium]